MSRDTSLAPGETSAPPVRVLMVCLGNICRSPMAEVVFRHHVERAGFCSRVMVASAGTGNWHVGERPHAGTLRVLAEHGLSADGKRAQSLEAVDPSDFDYLVAMDRANARDLGERAVLMLDFLDPRPLEPDVPDPYYTGAFDEVYALVDAASRGLLDHIVRERGLR